MRFGLCTELKNAPLAFRCGYDYIEPPLNKTALMSEEEFEEALSVLNSSGLKAEACALLFPKTLSIVGPAYNEEEMVSYLEKAFSRMNRIGASIVVFGSGKSRCIPSGMSYQDAFKELVERTKIVVSIAKKFNITVVIEALNKGETNLINSLTEASILSSLSGASMLVDAFHVRKEAETLDHIALCAPFTHAHIATLDGRRYPLEKNEELISFIKALKDTGYDARLSVEGKSDDIEKDSKVCLEVLREAIKEA